MAEREHTKTMAKTPTRTALKEQPKVATKTAIKPAGKALAKNKPPVAELPAAAIQRLETQNAQLAKALRDAEARITALELQRDGALDRIGWVIDSLHSLREEHG